MIETKEGLAKPRRQSAPTPGLDAVYIGPADLSVRPGGWPPRGRQPRNPLHLATCDKILAAAQ